MQFRPIRPPFVLCFAADQQGCGHHRINMPASALAAAGLIDARIDLQLWDEARLKAVKPDIVVFQRQIERGQIDAIKMVRSALPNAFLIYEIDDAMSHVPATSYHAGVVPPGIEGRIREALAICHAATTTTEPLATWLRSLGATDVRVVPNYISAEQMTERKESKTTKAKPRVGWAGGVSHDGDLALLVPAMNEIGTDVEWVFFGDKPKHNVKVPIEFHEGVHASQYLAKLVGLNLDLILAPLEDNYFNECKSNLRLIEAGACSAAVIAQALKPYVDGEPPVFSHVLSGHSWAPAIRKFINLPMSQRRQHGAAMRDWVAANYTFETQIERRLKAWLPANLPSHFYPAPAGKKETGGVVVCSPHGVQAIGLPSDAKIVAVEATIEDAAARAMTTGADLLWMRAGTALTNEAFARMKQEAVQPGIATTCCLGPDGVDGFPTRDRFTPTSGELASQFAAKANALWPGRQVDIVAPIAPAIFIRAPMLGLLGSPDSVGLDGNTEAAIIEWAVRASMREYKHVQIMDQYVGSLFPSQGLTEQMALRMQMRGAMDALRARKPTLSPEDRELWELSFVGEQWRGPRPGIAPYGSDYATWNGLKRTPMMAFAENGVVAAFGGPTPVSEWVVWIDDTVTLRPGAVGALIAAAGDADFVYADHEAELEDGMTPVFKSDFDYEMFLARDYITPIMACRTALFSHSPKSREMLYARVLQAAGTDWSRIAHLPVVYGSVKPLSKDRQQLATAQRARLVASVEHNAVPHPTIPDAVKVIRKVKGQPKVTIVICTAGDPWILHPCLLPLLNLTDYTNYEVVVISNAEDAVDLGEAAVDPRVSVLTAPGPFNWSVMNNEAVKTSDADYLLFLNDDTRIVVRDWLSAMVSAAQQNNVAVVGARLIFPQGSVQHVGVAAHNGLIGHIHLGIPAHSPGYNCIAQLTHESQAVTGACMLVSRKIYEELGGFREDLSHNYNDIAFCLDARKAGYRNVVEVRAELIHLGGASRPGPTSQEGMDRLIAENEIMGRDYVMPDPYWNPNFALIADGQGVKGLGYEILSWSEERPSGPRVMVINDTGKIDGTAADLTRDGAIVFLADIVGFELRMIAPSLVANKWDMRNLDAVDRALQTLDITYIVLSSLIGPSGVAAGVETLRGLYALSVPVKFQPRTPEVACPRLDFKQDGVDCGEGWRKGPAHCQACVDHYGSPFGHIDLVAWQTAWMHVMEFDRQRDAAD